MAQYKDMKDFFKKRLILAVKRVSGCINGREGHEIAQVISETLTREELQLLAATFKEAEIRRKHDRRYY